VKSKAGIWWRFAKGLLSLSLTPLETSASTQLCLQTFKVGQCLRNPGWSSAQITADAWLGKYPGTKVVRFAASGSLNPGMLK